MQCNEFSDALASLLQQFGNVLNEPDIRSATKDCRAAIFADHSAHNLSTAEPFFNFVVANGVAVFTFFESSFSVYAIKCNELTLIAETNEYALSETGKCRKYLAVKYNKFEADIVVSRNVCEQWLESV